MSQQMPVVYPVTTTIPSTTHSSNGSYGTVFIVLAVIVTISAFACFLGRICNKRQNEAKPRTHNLPTKDKGANKRNVNDQFQKKDGDIESGYDKRFAGAKVATTNEPTMHNPNPFGEPNMGRPNSFHEPTIGRPNSFQEPKAGQSSQSSSLYKANKVQPSFSPEPVMGRPNSYNEPTTGRPNSYNEPAMGRPNSYNEPAMGRPNSYNEPAIGRPNSYNDPPTGRPNSYNEPTMGRPNSYNEPTTGQPTNSFHKGESQGDQTRVDGDRDNDINFKFRTRPQRY